MQRSYTALTFIRYIAKNNVEMIKMRRTSNKDEYDIVLVSMSRFNPSHVTGQILGG